VQGSIVGIVLITVVKGVVVTWVDHVGDSYILARSTTNT
jgi:hypothetical protein